MDGMIYHDIMCPTLTKTGACTCKQLIEVREGSAVLPHVPQAENQAWKECLDLEEKFSASAGHIVRPTVTQPAEERRHEAETTTQDRTPGTPQGGSGVIGTLPRSALDFTTNEAQVSTLAPPAQAIRALLDDWRSWKCGCLNPDGSGCLNAPEPCFSCAQVIQARIDAANELEPLLTALLREAEADSRQMKRRIELLEDAMNPHDVCDVDAKLRAEDEEVRRISTLAGLRAPAPEPKE